MKRRDFVRAAVVLPVLIPSTAFAAPGKPGPNDRIRVGVAGLGGRASWILLNEDLPGGRVVAVADCCRPRCEQMVAAVTKQRPEMRAETWKKFPDIRKMLDAEKPDAVFVETTTHARVWCMMHALAAGCDVYGEKPLTLTVAEGRRLVEAVARSGRILQTGTQQRSMPVNAFASKLVREGAIGQVRDVVVCNFERPAVWKPQPRLGPQGGEVHRRRRGQRAFGEAAPGGL